MLWVSVSSKIKAAKFHGNQNSNHNIDWISHELKNVIALKERHYIIEKAMLLVVKLSEELHIMWWKVLYTRDKILMIKTD